MRRSLRTKARHGASNLRSNAATVTRVWRGSASEKRNQFTLEQAAVDLLTAFASQREAGAFVENLSCRVSNITKHDRPDPLTGKPAEWFVEATLSAFAENLAYQAA